MICKICENWAREASNTIEAHHPNCPRHPTQLMRLIAELATGIKQWADAEDGVPDWLWDAYQLATSLGTPPAAPRTPKILAWLDSLPEADRERLADMPPIGVVPEDGEQEATT